MARQLGMCLGLGRRLALPDWSCKDGRCGWDRRDEGGLEEDGRGKVAKGLAASAWPAAWEP